MVREAFQISVDIAYPHFQCGSKQEGAAGTMSRFGFGHWVGFMERARKVLKSNE